MCVKCNHLTLWYHFRTNITNRHEDEELLMATVEQAQIEQELQGVI